MSVLTSGDCARSLAVEALQSNGKLRLRVTGSSMLPTLWPGDLLTLDSVSSAHVHPGMIVLFERNDQFCIHRMVRQSNAEGLSAFVTRGDCMSEDDAPIPAAAVLGRVVQVNRLGRTLSHPDRFSPSQKALAWLLCHSDLLHRIALRWHARRSVENVDPLAPVPLALHRQDQSRGQ